MKKLLIILLLLFPVHGAWAENLFLECGVPNKIKMYYEMDLKNKTVKHYDDTYKIQYMDDKYFHWTMNHYYKKEGYSVMGYVSIDRVNGNIKVESSEPIPDAEVTKWLNTTSSRPPIDDTQYGKCSKWSGKKKF